MLSAKEISVDFGGVRALDGVNIDVPRGRVVAVVGPNGSGKSTLFNAITGFVRLNAGRVLLDDTEIHRLPSRKRVALGIARTFQTPRINPDMSVEQTIWCALTAKGQLTLFGAMVQHPIAHSFELQVRQKARDLLARMGLSEVASVPMGELPMGLVRLVDVARAMALSPKFLLLDEPAAGLSADEQGVLKEQVRRVTAEGVGVLLVEHNFGFVEHLSEVLTVLQRGRIIAHGTPAEVRDDQGFVTAYLGSTGRPGSHTSEQMPVEGMAEDSGAHTAVAPVREVLNPQPVLLCQEIEARYGKAQVTFGLNLELRAGEVVALLGANGAGKTSFLGAILGLVQASGSIQVNESSIDAAPGFKRPRLGVGLVPEVRGNVFPSMSVDENLAVAARHHRSGERSHHLEEVHELFPILQERSRTQAGMLSGGEQQMLALGMALLLQPKVLLMDEPTQGLAPAMFDVLERAITRISKDGIAVLVAEQNLTFAKRVASRFVVLSAGRIQLEANAGEIEDESTLQRAYFGRPDDEVIHA